MFLTTPTPGENLKGILFDLDGTLLQVEMKTFIPDYIKTLGSFFEDLADLPTFSEGVLAATLTLLERRDGHVTNEIAFLSLVEEHLGIPQAEFSSRLQVFCQTGLQGLARHVRSFPLSREILQQCFDRGLKVVLATNPVFPLEVVQARLQWAGLNDFPFDHITSFENSRFCKPDPRYFEEVLSAVGLRPQECLMVGNDTEHDLAAREAGILTFLVETCMIDRIQGNFVADFRGGHEDLLRILDERDVKAEGQLT